MTAVVLITVQPRAAATGVATTVRLAGGGNLKPYLYGGQQYLAGVAAFPRLKAEIGFSEEGWTGSVTPTTGNVIWAPATRASLDELAAYVWKGAAITIQEGDEATGVFTTRLTGKVAEGTVQDHQLLLTVADLGADLAKPLVTARFAGSGGVEGGTEAKGRIRRRTWGRAFNIEGRVLDKANNVYEFGDPAYPWQSFETLRDKGRAATPAPTIVAWQGSAAATLDALRSSPPVIGSGVVAPSICCAKWWTQPAGPLTADVKGEVGTGYVETAPSIAERILTAASGPTITNVAAANGWRGDVAGLHVDDGETIASAIDRLVMGISLLWILDPAGTVTFRQISFAGPIETLRSDSVNRLRTFKPTKTRRVGYQKAYRVHSDGDLLEATGDRQILRLAEKRDVLLPKLATLGARYTQITARAAAHGLSIAAATTAQTNALTYLGALSPAYNDVTQDTPLIANLVNPAIPVGWTVANGTTAANGIYRTLTDNSSSGGEIYTPFATTGSQTYTVGMVVKKDAVANATRNPGLRLINSNGTAKNADILFDTSIGVASFGGSSALAGDCYRLSDTEWLVFVSMVLNANNTGCYMDILPAFGASFAFNAATTGSIDMRDPVAVLGGFDSLGRDAMNYRMKAYEEQLDVLDKAVSEADADVAPEIQGASLILIECDSSGTPLTGALSRFENYKLYSAGTQVMSGITWSCTTPTGATTAITGSGTGQLEVSAINANEEILSEVQAARAGKATRRFPVTIRKNVAAPATGGGSGGGSGGSAASQTGSFTAISSGTAAVISQELQVTVGTGAQVAMTAALAPKGARSSPIGTWKIRLQWERWNGSAWVTQGSTFDTSPDTVVTTDSDSGVYIATAGSASSSLTYASSNGATVKMRLTAWIVSGSSTNTTKTINFTGQIGLQG